MTQREEQMRKVAYDLYQASEAEKRAKAKREAARGELFRLIDYDYKHKHHLLPVRTFEVPQSFFDDTGLSYQEFVDTRFPGWLVEHLEKNTQEETVTFILKKDPLYVNRTIEITADGQRINVSKEVSESTPEIDWNTLMIERPDLYDKLVKEVVVLELNEEALEQLMETEPEELAALQRHMIVKSPVMRVVPRKVKDDGENQ